MKLKMVLTCLSLSCSLLIASPVIAGNKGNSVEKMQQHWEMITSEKDVNKRSKLIEEHKVMMDEIDKANSGHHMNNMSGDHMDMNNTMDMHRSMIQIME